MDNHIDFQKKHTLKDDFTQVFLNTNVEMLYTWKLDKGRVFFVWGSTELPIRRKVGQTYPFSPKKS